MRIAIRICGEGGQGSIWTATTLGISAVKHAGLHAAEMPFYGPEITGGYSRADIIVSDEEVDFPKVIEADLLVAQAQESFDDDYRIVAPHGHAVVDSIHVRDMRGFDGPVLSVPASRISEDEFGSERFSNSVLLGFLNTIFDIVPPSALTKGVVENSPSRFVQPNLRALERGAGYVESVSTLRSSLDPYRDWKEAQ